MFYERFILILYKRYKGIYWHLHNIYKEELTLLHFYIIYAVVKKAWKESGH